MIHSNYRQETEQSKRKKKFISVLCPVLLFPCRERVKEKLMWFLWGNKGWKSCTQIRMQKCSSVLLWCQGRKGKHWRSSWEKRKSPSAPWQAMPEVTFRVPHTLKHTHQSTAPGYFCFVNHQRVWEIFHPARSFPAVKYSCCQFTVYRKHICFNLRLFFKSLDDFRSPE